MLLQVSPVNERELRRISRLLLKTLIEDDQGAQVIRTKLNEARAYNRCLAFREIWTIIIGNFKKFIYH